MVPGGHFGGGLQSGYWPVKPGGHGGKRQFGHLPTFGGAHSFTSTIMFVDSQFSRTSPFSHSFIIGGG